MDGKIIKSKYPKAYQFLSDWVLEEVKKTNVPKEVLETFPIEKAINGMISNSNGIRSLFDFFDHYEIYFHVAHGWNGDVSIKDQTWFCSINDDEIDETIFHSSRLKAEEVGFTRCFELLNEKL